MADIKLGNRIYTGIRTLRMNTPEGSRIKFPTHVVSEPISHTLRATDWVEDGYQINLSGYNVGVYDVQLGLPIGGSSANAKLITQSELTIKSFDDGIDSATGKGYVNIVVNAAKTPTEDIEISLFGLVEAPVAHLYNEIRLGIKPEYDSETYPYSVVCKDDGVYSYMAFSEYSYGTAGDDRIIIYDVNSSISFKLVDDVWMQTEPTEQYKAHDSFVGTTAADDTAYYKDTLENLNSASFPFFHYLKKCGINDKCMVIGIDKDTSVFLAVYFDEYGIMTMGAFTNPYGVSNASYFTMYDISDLTLEDTFRNSVVFYSRDKALEYADFLTTECSYIDWDKTGDFLLSVSESTLSLYVFNKSATSSVFDTASSAETWMFGINDASNEFFHTSNYSASLIGFSLMNKLSSLVWANTNILNEDNTVYMTATDPIPVYETTGDSITITVHDDRGTSDTHVIMLDSYGYPNSIVIDEDLIPLESGTE